MEVVDFSVVGVIDQRLPGNQVHDSFEFVLGSDRQGKGNGSRPQLVLDLLEACEKICPHPVHLVHIDDLRNFEFVRLSPNRFGLGLNFSHGIEGGHTTVEHTQGTLNFNREVDVARSVDEIQLINLVVVMPECRGGGGGDGDPPLLLLNHPVHGSATVVNLSDFVDLARIIQDPFRRCCLTGINVRDDTDVSCKC